MKNDYRGYLILSDYDGTFSDGEVPEENVRAVKYFTEHGGLFSFCTGRAGEPFFDENPYHTICNAPLVGYSGAELYDLTNRKPLETFPLHNNYAEILRDMFSEIPSIYHMDFCSAHHGAYFDTANTEITDRVLSSHYDDVMKIVIYHREKTESMIPKIALDVCGDRASLCSNCPGTFEILLKGVNKGVTARYLKKKLGAHTLIGAGDYHGDISLIQAADIGYAVANAVDEVKAVADRVTVDVRDAALAAIIADI